MEENQKASGAWVLLGLICPIAGLVLFIVFRNKKPDLSKKSGIGALIGTIISVVFFIIYFAVIIGVLNAYYTGSVAISLL